MFSLKNTKQTSVPSSVCVAGVISREMLHSTQFDVALTKQAFAPNTSFALYIIGTPLAPLPGIPQVTYHVLTRWRSLFFPPSFKTYASLVVFDDLDVLGRLVRRLPKALRVLVLLERGLEERSAALRFFGKRRIMRALMRATRVFAPTSAIVTEVKSFAPSAKVDLLSPPLFVEWILTDTHTLREVFPQFTLVMVVLCDFLEIRGLAYIAEILPNIVSQYPKFGVVVIGEGPEILRAKQLAKDAHMEPHMLFLGKRDDVQLLMTQADMACVYQTQCAPIHAQLRAIAASAPLILAKEGLAAGVLPEHIVHSVAKNSPEALANTIASFVQDTDGRLQNRKNLRELANKAALTRGQYISRVYAHIAQDAGVSV